MKNVVFIAALALAALSWTESQAGDPPLPEYPGATRRQFVGKLSANSAPIDALIVTTADSLEKVLDYYRQQIKQMGKTPVEHHFNVDLAYVGYFDEANKNMVLATVYRQPDGTMIILSSMNPAPLLMPAEIPPEIPRLEGAKDVVVTGDEEGGRKRYTVSYMLSGVPLDKTRQNLLEEARRLGWKEDRPARGGEKLLTLRRDGRICVANLAEIGKGEAARVQISMVVFDE